MHAECGNVPYCMSWLRLQRKMAAAFTSAFVCSSIWIGLGVVELGWMLSIRLQSAATAAARIQSAMQEDNRNMTFPCPCPCPGADAALPVVTAAAQRTPLPVGANFSSVWYFSNVVVAVAVAIADVVIAVTCPTMLQTQVQDFFLFFETRHAWSVVEYISLATCHVKNGERERLEKRES